MVGRGPNQFLLSGPDEGFVHVVGHRESPFILVPCRPIYRRSQGHCLIGGSRKSWLSWVQGTDTTNLVVS